MHESAIRHRISAMMIFFPVILTPLVRRLSVKCLTVGEYYP